jgi:hypothetical protein
MVSFLLAFPLKSHMRFSSPLLSYMPCPAHLIILGLAHSDRIRRIAQVNEAPDYSVFSKLLPFSSPLLSKYSPQHAVLSLSLCSSSLNVRDQVLHPYETTGKIMNQIINQILICYCLPKYLNFNTSTKDILAVFILWFCHAVWWRDINIRVFRFLCFRLDWTFY